MRIRRVQDTPRIMAMTTSVSTIVVVRRCRHGRRHQHVAQSMGLARLRSFRCCARQASLEADKKFLKELKTSCGTKTSEWEEPVPLGSI